MKILETNVYEGRNIYSHKKCIKIIVDLEEHYDTPSKDISGFNNKLLAKVPNLYTHRCGIDEEGGFVKRLHEGTYLAHICEHIIIAIQNTIGIEVAYGKSREIKRNIYFIVFQYECSKTALDIARLAVDLINSLIRNEDLDIDNRIDRIKATYRNEMIGPSTKEICDAARRKGLPIISILNGEMHQIGYGKQGRIIEGSITSNTSCIAVDISCNKSLTKELLIINNIPVANGCKIEDKALLSQYANSIGYPVVLKPESGNKAKGIILNIKNEIELVESFKKVEKKYNDLIIEKYYEGNDYRVCVVDYKVVAVARKIMPSVIGDGVKSIESLIKDINSSELRGEDHEKELTKIIIDEELKDIINKEGYTITSVLEKGRKINLRANSNLSKGGTSIDCTEIISEENKEICSRIAKIIGLDICGIDIRSKDISKSINDTGIILEVNASPGLRMHTRPQQGNSVGIGDYILDMLYKGEFKNIPVISITGTNGKTTTTRLIGNTLNRMGYFVGMTSTEGIYLNGKCIDYGDDTGVNSAKCVLFNKDIDIAVLETARGGIIRKGLAYDLADVAVVTNITEDHLGCDNINSMEDLCHVKSLVAEAVKPNGYVVINADDRWSKNIISRIKSNIIYFSKKYNNKYILENIKNNGIAVYIKNNAVYATNRGREYHIIDIVDIPITLNGVLDFNVENAMASCAALIGMGIDYSMIKIGLKNFELNSDENRGRFNIFDYNGIKVILDYGHNIEGYEKVLLAVNKISKGKKIGVVGMPGDRRDSSIKEVGKVISKYLDSVIIKEDINTRGRKRGEIAEIIKSSALESNCNIEVEVIYDEVEAFNKALNSSKEGDTLIVFFEKINPLKEILDKKSNLLNKKI